jgi:hypothetical protein
MEVQAAKWHGCALWIEANMMEMKQRVN